MLVKTLENKRLLYFAIGVNLADIYKSIHFTTSAWEIGL